MTETESVSEPEAAPPEPPVWARAAPADLRDLDFERPIAGSNAADCHDLSDMYRKAVAADEQDKEEANTPTARVFAMLAGVTGLLLRPADRKAPYGAMAVFSDSRRSALPEDFRDAPLAVLAEMAEQATHPALQARLCDLVWLLDRRRTALGREAVAAYVSLINVIELGALVPAHEKDDPATGHLVSNVLRRALQIDRARSIGWDDPTVVPARQRAAALRTRTLTGDSSVRVHWFTEIDLDFGLSPPAEVAVDVEAFLSAHKGALDTHSSVDLWRMAARAYHHAEQPDDQHRCQIAAYSGRSDLEALRMGRKPKLTPHQRKEALERRTRGEPMVGAGAVTSESSYRDRLPKLIHQRTPKPQVKTATPI